MVEVVDHVMTKDEQRQFENDIKAGIAYCRTLGYTDEQIDKHARFRISPDRSALDILWCE